MIHPVRKYRLYIIFGTALIVGLALALILFSLKENISLFYTPSDIFSNRVPYKITVRLGGMVQKNTVKHDSKKLLVTFDITDFSHVIKIHYQGVLPDLFREGQGVVVKGMLISKDNFLATEVLAKHDENYMPPEVRDSLKIKGAS